MADKKKLSPIMAKILTVLLKTDEYMTTTEISEKAKISWNTALHYLKIMYDKGWVEKEGERTIYWKAIVEE